MNGCCKPYLYAWWDRGSGSRPSIFQRHNGRTCVGQMDQLNFNLWYSTGERRIIR